MNDNAFMVDKHSNVVLLGRELVGPRLVLEHDDGTYSCSCTFGRREGRMRALTKIGKNRIPNTKVCFHVRAVLRTHDGDWGDGIASIGGADGMS